MYYENYYIQLLIIAQLVPRILKSIGYDYIYEGYFSLSRRLKYWISAMKISWLVLMEIRCELLWRFAIYIWSYITIIRCLDAVIFENFERLLHLIEGIWIPKRMWISHLFFCWECGFPPIERWESTFRWPRNGFLFSF